MPKFALKGRFMTHKRHRRFHLHSKPADIVKPVDHLFEIANAVPVCIQKALRTNVAQHRVARPRLGGPQNDSKSQRPSVGPDYRMLKFLRDTVLARPSVSKAVATTR